MARKIRHVGAYGVCTFVAPNGATYLLLIEKTRGPYTGLLDLPGGGLEWGEEPEAALRREFHEETGATLAGHVSLIGALSQHVLYRAADGMDEDLHHVGFLYRVALADTSAKLSRVPPPLPGAAKPGEDAAGCVWFSLAEGNDARLSPFARRAAMAARLHGGGGGALAAMGSQADEDTRAAGDDR